LGVPVFPCHLGAKPPATEHGFKDATADRDQIDYWWRRADYKIGIEPERFPEPLWVVDLDGDVGLATWEALQTKHRRVPPTLTVITPSGGMHLYFAGSGPTTAKKLGPGIDTRGRGGYVLVPPSVVNGKPYVWVRPRALPAPPPRWLRDLLELPSALPRRTPTSFVRRWGGSNGLEEYLSRIGDHEGGEGFYGPMLRAAGAGVRAGLDPDELFDRIADAARAADQTNHTAADVEDRIDKMPAAIARFLARDAALPPPPEQSCAEVPLSAEKASARLREIQTDFFARPKGRRLLIKAPPGLGKTALALIEGLRHSIGFLPEGDLGAIRLEDILDKDRQVAFFVPTHKLAGQMGDDVKAIYAKGWLQGGAYPLRGRTHGDPPLCLRAAEATALTAKGLPVYRNLCEDGVDSRCPHFKKCPYIRQKWQAKRAELVTAMHTHLPTGPCPENDHYWDPRWHSDVWVIDEDPTATLLSENSFDRTDIERLGDLGADVMTGLAASGGLLTHVAAKGWSAERLRIAAKQREAAEAAESHVTRPTDKIDPARLKPYRPLAPVISRLADEMASGRGGAAYSLILVSQDRVRAQSRKPLDYSADQPILITDGTANVEILRQWMPDLVEERLSVRRNASVVQVTDLTFSKDWLLNRGGLHQVERFIAAKAAQYPRGPNGGGLLVVTNKEIRFRITGEQSEGTAPRSAPALGADIAHFGHIRGANDFADHDAVIIVGRKELPLEVAERSAMAIWYDSPTPLQFLAPDDAGRMNYPEFIRDYQMSNGARLPGRVRAHPDPRVQAVVEQAREAETLQAIDRLRLVHNAEPKPVYILCSIPLADIEVDRLVTWEELAGIERLNDALDRCAGGLAPALPLSPRWMSSRLAEIWGSENAAKAWLRDPRVADLFEKSSKGGTPNIITLAKPPFENSSAAEALQPAVTYWREVEYRRADRRGGRASRALVPNRTNPVAAIAAALGCEPAEIMIIKKPWSPPSYKEEARPVE